jgi:hypothetical protein
MDKHAKEGFILRGLGEYFEVFGRFYLTRTRINKCNCLKTPQTLSLMSEFLLQG